MASLRSASMWIVSALCICAFPFFTYAFPFGGAIGIIKPCYNNAIYAALGPPRGGPYIWTPATRTYQFGPPRHTGQWLLGLASAPYYCVISIFPVIVWPGTHIDMMGSSGGAAPAYTPPTTQTTPEHQSPSPGMTPEQIEAAKKACESNPGCIWN